MLLASFQKAVYLPLPTNSLMMSLSLTRFWMCPLCQAVLPLPCPPLKATSPSAAHRWGQQSLLGRASPRMWLDGAHLLMILQVGRREKTGGGGWRGGRRKEGSKKRGDEGGLGVGSPASSGRAGGWVNRSERYAIKAPGMATGSVLSHSCFPFLPTSHTFVKGVSYP